MENTTKRHLKILGAYILSMVLLAVSIGIIVGLLLKSCSEITDRGLKNVVEEVWEGKQNKGVIE